MKKGNRCECLDFVEASHRHNVYPVMYCHLELTGHFDINCIKAAIQSTCRYVPEVLYTYDFRRGRFSRLLEQRCTVLLMYFFLKIAFLLYNRQKKDGKKTITSRSSFFASCMTVTLFQFAG